MQRGYIKGEEMINKNNEYNDILGDLSKDIDNIAPFAIKLDPDNLHLTASIPYPGSRFYFFNKSKKKLQFDKDIPRMYEGFCEFNQFNREFITKKVMQIYKQFYLRPKFIIKQVFSVESCHDLLNLFLGGLFLLKMLIKKLF